MPQESDLKGHYQAVIQDLESERQSIIEQITPLQNKLKELHASILILAKRINPDAPSHSTASLRPTSLKYVNLSVRWAILDLMNNSAEPMTTAQIAEALVAAGVQSRAANFANNVSAVLSTTMKERHNEVMQSGDGRWMLTDRGRDAIAHIKGTPKFRRAVSWL